ncbi:MAG TPA: hypothetical protein VIV12_12455 [Streptosporangiaceae bacterium]
MPLDYTSTALDIPASAFNADGLAVLLLQGGRYGGDWVIHAVPFQPKADREDSYGRLDTFTPSDQALLSDPRYPYLAVESAFIWLNDQARQRGWRVVAWECLNAHYGAQERPYFCAARAIVTNQSFVPVPDVTYADEQTLDQVMGYTSAPQP